ncbi:MAG: hypothetical protein JO101_00710 [Candidatus Eremiobacteraeota bacterium]|nr:hypothetical protein [Candidatus Eremiobacteraeota bacterium]MBV8353815.1 hypothetical protein [Candidatus Eremiobacteraeota bacterium]
MHAAVFVLAAELVSLAGGERLVVEHPAAGTPVRGAVLLIPGGSTTLNLGANGETGSPNFVIRTRALLRDAGFVTAYMDDPENLRDAIARLRAVATPVIVVSTSRGTLVATDNTARLGNAGPDLLVLTSPITTGSKKNPTAIGISTALQISVPTLVVANQHDACAVSTPGGAEALAAAFSPPATFVSVDSTQTRGDPCGPTSPHGFLGIESDVINQIVSWVASTQARATR